MLALRWLYTSRLDVLAESGPLFAYDFHRVVRLKARKTCWNLVGTMLDCQQRKTTGSLMKSVIWASLAQW
jgi:hypothetical protein